MRVTVCELNDRPDLLEQDWQGLVEHVKSSQAELVLLPEMPFHPWVACTPAFDPAAWNQAVAAHDAWLPRLSELAPAVVLGTRPVNANPRVTGFAGMSGFAEDVLNRKRLNEGFTWSVDTGYRRAHHKYHLPEDEGFWEATWYQPGDGDFKLVQAGPARVGFLICSELWFMQHARRYGQQGAQIVVTPRCTGKNTVDKWLVGGRASAVISGAYSLSSNRVCPAGNQPQFGGQGWVVGPDGDVLALTSTEQPFVTVDIDLAVADQAKQTYPRYMPD